MPRQRLAVMFRWLSVALVLAACNRPTTTEFLPSPTAPTAAGAVIPKDVDTPTVAPLPASTGTATSAPATEAPSPTMVPPTPEAASPTQTSPAPTPVPVAQPTSTPIASGVPVTVTVIHMLSETAGWATGLVGADNSDHILRTADGGYTWQDVTPAGQSGWAVTLFLDPQNAWVIFEGDPSQPPSTSVVVWRTANGGRTWAASLPIDTSGGDFFSASDLTFVDAQHGWLMGHVGAGMMHDWVMMFATSDGGTNWTRVVDPFDSTLDMVCCKTGLAFLNTLAGWVTGDSGSVVPGAPYFQRTIDGGQAWAAQTITPPGDAPDLFTQDTTACGTYSLTVTSATTGAVVMRCSFDDSDPTTNKSWLYITGDGGQAWTSGPLPLPFGTLEFVSPQVGWWLGASASDASGSDMYQTRDGGQTWAFVRKVNWKAQLDFVTEQVGWAVVQPGTAYALVKTANAGQKWAVITPVIAP